MNSFFQDSESVLLVSEGFLPLFFEPLSSNSPWLLALLYSALLFDGNMNLSHYKGTDSLGCLLCSKKRHLP